MTVKFDKAADAVYFSFRSSEVDHTKSVDEDINIDLDAEGWIVGIEVLNYSKHANDPDAITLGFVTDEEE